jgi:hypothetical protein
MQSVMEFVQEGVSGSERISDEGSLAHSSRDTSSFGAWANRMLERVRRHRDEQGSAEACLLEISWRVTKPGQ